MKTTMTRTRTPIELEERHAAHNYEPLPVVLTRGEGAISGTSKAGATST